jgi:hypothetical protein
MSLKSSKKAEREKQLQLANEQINLLGNFFNLALAFLGANLLELIRKEVTRFIDELEDCMNSIREPLFHAELSFDTFDKMSMLPNKEKFVNDIISSILNMSKLIINASRVLDFEGILRDFEKYGYSLIKYSASFSFTKSSNRVCLNFYS